MIDECQWKQGLGANFYPVEFGKNMIFEAIISGGPMLFQNKKSPLGSTHDIRPAFDPNLTHLTDAGFRTTLLYNVQ